MPKTPVDYSKTKIYKIVCNDLAVKELYVGNTTDFVKRRHSHKNNCINHSSKHFNCKVYQYIRDNGGWDNWNMILIEDYPCNNKLEAERQERHWFETLNATLNTNFPSRNYNEWKQDNREHFLNYQKEYYEENKEHRLKQCSNRYFSNKEALNSYYNEKILCACGSYTSRRNKARHEKSQTHITSINSQN
jgi:hypothetical protein